MNVIQYHVTFTDEITLPSGLSKAEYMFLFVSVISHAVIAAQHV